MSCSVSHVENLLNSIILMEAQTYRSRADALLNQERPKAEEAVDILKRSRFSVSARLQFRSRISGILRRNAGKMAQLGWEAGGGSGGVPVQLVREYQARQQGLLSGWFAQIKGTQKIPGGKVRAGMYVSSLEGLYNEAWAAAQGALGMPDLLAVPGDGTTQCRVNCHCGWTKLKKTAPDTYVAYWKLREAEHCPTCLCRAKHWNPLTFTKIGGAWVSRTSGGAVECALFI